MQMLRLCLQIQVFYTFRGPGNDISSHCSYDGPKNIVYFNYPFLVYMSSKPEMFVGALPIPVAPPLMNCTTTMDFLEVEQLVTTFKSGKRFAAPDGRQQDNTTTKISERNYLLQNKLLYKFFKS